jgi:hypothetical protein
MRISTAGNRMESPAESNSFAVVQDLEDGEILRDDDSAGSLRSLLLIDQVLFSVDRWCGRVRVRAVPWIDLTLLFKNHGFPTAELTGKPWKKF